MSLLSNAKKLIDAIECNYLSCKEDGIDTTGSYIKQQYISEEMENLKNSIKESEERCCFCGKTLNEELGDHMDSNSCKECE